MIKPITVLGFLAIAVAPVFAQQKNKKKIVTKPKAVLAAPMFQNQNDSASYAFGLSMARDLKKRGLKHLNGKLVAQAIEDIYTDTPIRLNEEDEYQTISKVLMAATEELKKEQSAAGDEFLAQNKVKSGVHTTASGLQYEVLREGNGPKPLLTDSVTVHYKGSLLSGKVFDSSYDRGEPISLLLNSVIEGWQEGLQLMPVGAQYRFYVPYQLAYGERGAGADIPPYSVLIFEIELIKVGS